jgi:hypothetical protein
VIESLRLAWRLQRAEIFFVAAGCLALAGLAMWLAFDMRSIHAACGTPAATAACDVIYSFQNSHGHAVQVAQMVIEYVPFAAGLVLGVPIVTREVEQRTALIAWPMARSRLRWMAWRAAPIVLIGLAAVGLLAVAADQMAHAYVPNADLGFSRYEARGLPLVMRTLLMLAAGLAIGAIVGRQLPALLLGIGASVAVVAALAFALPSWVPSTVLADMETDPAAMIGGRLHTAVHYRMPNGEIVTSDEGEIYAESIYQEALPDEPDPSLLPQLIISGVAADRYPEVVTRESLAVGVGAVVLIGLAGAAVQRRRPE